MSGGADERGGVGMRQVAPTRDDDLVRSVSEVVGGPLGDHAGRHPWWTPLRVVLVLGALAMSLGIMAKAPCLDVAGETTTGRYAALCWTDTSTTYVASGFAEGLWPFTDDAQARARYAPSGLPPLPGYVAFVSQRITGLLSGSPDLDARGQVSVAEVAEQPEVQREAAIFSLVTAVLLAAAGLFAAALLSGVRRQRPWDAAAFAMAPVLIAFFPIAWDLLAAAAVAATLWAWARERRVLAGVAIGVGAAASPLVALLLVPAVAVLGRDRRWPQAGTVALAACATWLLLTLPAWASSPAAWRASWRGHVDGADIGSLWQLASEVTGRVPSTRVLLLALALALVCLAAVVGHLAWRARWSFASLGTLTIAVALFVSPTSSPGLALVLLPLAVVAVRSWTHLLVWQGCEIIHWAMLGFYLGGALAPAAGGDARAYWWGIAMRLGGLVWLIGATALVAGDAGPGSDDDDAVEAGRGEADPDLEVLADVRHPSA
ncbi:glycosyltransferase 87 family protein [Nocardioides piscis]|uniref:DUF2029 domain-containing protein n=1 Tax=Nocardioides piscis TaxID=2714938 RepID=A0A6G7YE72_9ACTN|nr:glycosyltransferase 87 family protein [Nocardioides piscis]QIK74941.1 DUF2029 domain-containing protein [Nocardioides piscis]